MVKNLTEFSRRIIIIIIQGSSVLSLVLLSSPTFQADLTGDQLSRLERAEWRLANHKKSPTVHVLSATPVPGSKLDVKVRISGIDVIEKGLPDGSHLAEISLLFESDTRTRVPLSNVKILENNSTKGYVVVTGDLPLSYLRAPKRRVDVPVEEAGKSVFQSRAEFNTTERRVAAIRKAVADVPVLELPTKAAKIVQQASEQERQKVAITVARIVLSKKPALASTLLEAIAEVAPESSATVAALAAELCPAQAQEIAQIAASYSPKDAPEIATNVAKAAPRDAIRIARRVVGAVPELSDKITEAVIAAVPTARQGIESDATLSLVSALARNTDSSVSVPVRKFIGKQPVPRPPRTSPQTQMVAPQPRSQVMADILETIEKTSVATKLKSRAGGPYSVAMLTGKIVFTYDGDGLARQIYIQDTNGMNRRRLTGDAGQGENFQPALSADAQRIVFTSTRTGNHDVFSMKIDGTEQRQLTISPGNDDAPFFHPSGRWIVFGSDRQGQHSIMVMPSTGETTQNPAVQLPSGVAQESDPAFNSTGTKIVFQSDDNIWLMRNGDDASTRRKQSHARSPPILENADRSPQTVLRSGEFTIYAFLRFQDREGNSYLFVGKGSGIVALSIALALVVGGFYSGCRRGERFRRENSPGVLCLDSSKYRFREWVGDATGIAAIVFTDIVGYTKLVSLIGNIEASKVRDAHFLRTRMLLRKLRGCEIDTAGDGFFVLFRTAAQALEFALALTADTGVGLITVRIGVHVGTIHVTENGIVGCDVNLASRICACAMQAGILLSDRAKQDIDAERKASFSNLKWKKRRVKLKGLKREQFLWRVQ